MERIKKADVLNALENVNRYLQKSGYELKLGERYGYKAIDVGYVKKPHRMKETIKTGLTSREAYDMLWAMARAIELSHQKAKKVI